MGKIQFCFNCSKLSQFVTFYLKNVVRNKKYEDFVWCFSGNLWHVPAVLARLANILFFETPCLNAQSQSVKQLCKYNCIETPTRTNAASILV